MSRQGVPEFITFLGSLPAATQVGRAMVRGPLASFRPRAFALWRRTGEELVLIAVDGLADDEVRRVCVLPLGLETVLTAATRQARVVVARAEDFQAENRAAFLDEQMWARMMGRTRAAALVNVPVVSGGGVVGAFGFISDLPWPGDELAHAVLDTLRGGLALWLVHPRGGALAPMVSGGPPDSIVLSGRQVAILARVESGESNVVIAGQLGYSQSTVKQDIQRAMRTLRVSDRKSAVEVARSLGLL